MTAPLQTGDRVGPYQLAGVLGAGGAGQVFRAVWDPTEGDRADAPDDHPREVALKLMRPDMAANAAMFHRFVREIGLAQTIHHPHILRHVGSGLANDYLYYAMEIATHGTLRELLIKRKRVPWREAAESAAHIADGLSTLHQAGVVHRDLKPDNVFLAEDGAVKLGDFGLALKDEASRLTLDGQTVGSARYMSPEQVMGKSDLDGRSDLYALGCVLMEMIAGRGPFTLTDTYLLFQAHVEEAPPRLRALASDAPASLDALVDQLLSKRRELRPVCAASVRRALEAIVAAPDGEVAELDELLDGTLAEIEPMPEIDDEEDEESSLSGRASSTLGRVVLTDLPSAPPEEDPEDPEPVAPTTDLSQRLAAGGGDATRQGCLGVIAWLAVTAAAVAAWAS